MKCPGQDPRYWKFDAIFDAECPNCGTKVEFFKDETRRRCKNCGHHVLNPKMDFGCAAHCKFAEHCFGDLPPELIKQKEDLFKDRVAVAVKLHFKQDFKSIGHAARVARYAEKIVQEEKGDPAVVMSAAYLLDTGITEAERKSEQGIPNDDETDCCDVAREILGKLDARGDLIDEVCNILGRRHNPGGEETANFKVVYDADMLANLEDGQKKDPLDAERLFEIIESRFLTPSGKELARSLFLGEDKLRAVGN
jgi:hypothetical protein